MKYSALHQVPWLDAVYAALGAILFTMVSDIYHSAMLHVGDQKLHGDVIVFNFLF